LLQGLGGISPFVNSWLIIRALYYQISAHIHPYIDTYFPSFNTKKKTNKKIYLLGVSPLFINLQHTPGLIPSYRKA